MPPRNPLNDVLDCVPRDTIPLSEVSNPVADDTPSVKRSDLKNLCVCQLCSRVVLASCLSFFLLSIVHVILTGSEEKMIWIDTDRVVAGVKDAEICLSIVKYPREFMCAADYSTNLRLFNNEDAVPTFFCCSSPFPAVPENGVKLSVFIDLSPEPSVGRTSSVNSRWHLTAPLTVPKQIYGRSVGFRLFGDQPSRTSIVPRRAT